MIKDFGENLKSLRRKMDLTQEELAAILNVSIQSISRWETNMGYPDIEMLPIIAHFYGVSVDSLLGIDVIKQNELITQMINKINEFRTKGQVKLAIEECRQSLREYPNDFRLMSTLASCLFNHGENSEEVRVNNQEVITICEKILKYCKEDSIRYNAMLLLCYTYPKFDKTEKAIEIANTMPSYYNTSNEILRSIIDTNQKKCYVQRNLLALLQLISRNIEELFSISDNYDEKIRLMESLITIYQGFFDQEDYYFFHSILHKAYRYLSAIYADKKDAIKTIENLEKASYHAIAYDTRSVEHTYTSSPFNGFKESISNTITNSITNNSWVLLDRLADARYDFIKEDTRYLKLIDSLKQVAKN